MKAAIDLLRALGTGAAYPRNTIYGICAEIKRLEGACLITQNAVEHICDHMMQLWPKYSGNRIYPVPHPTKTPVKAFIHTDNLWIGKYGALRKELCLWLADQLEAEQ